MFLILVITTKIIVVALDVVLDVTIAKLLPNENNNNNNKKNSRNIDALYVWSMTFLYTGPLVIIFHKEVKRTSE